MARAFGAKATKTSAVEAVVLAATRKANGDVVLDLGPPPGLDYPVGVGLTVIDAPPRLEDGVPGTVIAMTANRVTVAGLPWADRVSDGRVRLIPRGQP